MENTRSTRNHKESVNMIHQTSLTPECAYWSEDTTNKHTNTQASKYTGLSLFSSAVCIFPDIIPASAVLLVSTRQTRLVSPWVPLSLNESADAQWKGAGRTHLEIKVKPNTKDWRKKQDSKAVKKFHRDQWMQTNVNFLFCKHSFVLAEKKGRILLWCLPAIPGRNWQSHSVSVSLSLEIRRRARSNDFQRKLLQISSSSPSVVPPEIVFLGGSISPEVLSANFCRGLLLKHCYTRPYSGWKATFCFEIFVWSVHPSPAEDHGEVPTRTTEKSGGRDPPS